ncbi:12563_t:CDS:2 [Acaulospora morrowiae]|uniref:12563_t:CDS:1 n=1 Tax=Acaulospora morrowiae TaxID=94023 RepID=A0A9N9BS95_9GLOM|nr:12563_t:CDS:2 [Acaulospora morrowiae]
MSSNNKRIPLEDAIIVGGEAISRAALEFDVRLIMHRKCDFTTFTSVWSHYNFSLIHFACPEKTGRSVFMQNLYQLFIGYYHTSRLVEVKLGVLYGIYLLFFTQPDNLEKIRIRISLSMYSGYCQQHDLFDAEYIYERLVAESAFELVAVVDPCGEYGRDRRKKRGMIPNSISEIKREMTMAPMGEFENPDSLDKLEQIANQYYAKKRKIADTEEAKVASRKVTRQKMKSNPPSDCPLDIWSIVAPLSASDENITTILRDRIEQIKNERHEFLTKDDSDQNEDTNSEDDQENATAFQIRNKIRSQPYNTKRRQYVPFAMQATVRAMERDAEVRSSGAKAQVRASNSLDNDSPYLS